jgi:hypothetical protein
MTQTFSVNSNNDLFLGIDGNISISYDLQAVLENCAHIVKVRLGEVVLNTDQGLPYFETVWNGVPNLIQFESAARNALLQIDGVTEVVSFKISIVDDVLVYLATIRTIYGEGAING